MGCFQAATVLQDPRHRNTKLPYSKEDRTLWGINASSILISYLICAWSTFFMYSAILCVIYTDLLCPWSTIFMYLEQSNISSYWFTMCLIYYLEYSEHYNVSSLLIDNLLHLQLLWTQSYLSLRLLAIGI